jgi:hypothetical protein
MKTVCPRHRFRNACKEELTFADGERHVVDGCRLTEALGDALQRDRDAAALSHAARV